jgi:Glycosyl transferases group 1
MPLRYLFGPVSASFAEQNLNRQRQAGECLVFNSDGDTDLNVKASGDSWETTRAKFPEGWEPDFAVLNLAYGTIPRFLRSLPLPKFALATDWHLLWHYYRACLSRFDLVLTDTLGAEVMVREGIPARAASLHGCERALVESVDGLRSIPEGPRDIDVLFVGNLNPVVQHERARWMTRLARLGHRWRVQIRSGMAKDSYLRLLKRARVVFQFSSRGKMGRRALEAAYAGTLIFQEAENRELPTCFRDREECVYYRSDNFEELVTYYLEHEEERAALANAARQRAQTWRFEEFWQEQVAAFE